MKYEVIEYLESTGTQYINTNVLSTSNTRLLVYGNCTTTATSVTIAGSYLSNSQRFHIGVYSNKFHFGCGSQWINGSNVDTNVHLFELDGSGYGKLDSTSYTLATQSTTDKTILLFGRNDPNYPAGFSAFKMQYCKIYENNLLIRDYIPVKVDGVGYMYDKISGQLFENAGTGEFVCGPDVLYYDAEIEYLESTGTLYINTGIKVLENPEHDYSVSTKIYLNSSSVSQGTLINCNKEVSPYPGWYIRRNMSNNTVQVGLKGTSEVNIGDVNTEIEYTGTILSADNNRHDVPLTFFASLNSSLQPWRYANGRIYRFKIEGIVDLIPVRIGSVGYMYDKVSGQLFGNSGTGSFILGPDVASRSRIISIRRKMLQLMPKTNLKPFNYVLDGLVFHLDGIRKGNKVGYWSDLINGYDFEIIKGMTSTHDGIEFSSSDFETNTLCRHLPITERLSTLCSEATVEVVCSYYNGFGFIWTSNSDSGTCFCFYNNNLGINNSITTNYYSIPDQSLFRTGVHTYSITLDNAYCDTTPFSKSGSTYFSTQNAGMNIGSRGTGNRYTGIIKSIRIYSRKLTPGEVVRNAIVDNRRFNLGLGSLLPYDTEIEYLESTGVQYIDTEIIPTLLYSFECGFYYVSYDNVTDASATLFGCQSTWITESFTLLVTPSKKGLYNCWGNKYTMIEKSNNTTYWNTLIGVWHTLEFKNKETYIDGIKKLSAVSNTSGEPTLSIHLFNCLRNGNPTFGKGSIKRISYAKIFNENGILLIDLIPVRVGNVGYMYDRISNQLFANAGTGDFILGPDVS